MYLKGLYALKIGSETTINFAVFDNWLGLNYLILKIIL